MAIGSTQLVETRLALRFAADAVYPTLAGRDDPFTAEEQAEADRRHAALLESLGGSSDEDAWDDVSPFELEETLEVLGEDISLALAR